MNDFQQRIIDSTPEGDFSFFEDDLWAWDPFPGWKWHSILRFDGRNIDFVNATKESTNAEELAAIVRLIPNDVRASAAEVIWVEAKRVPRFGGVLISDRGTSQSSPMDEGTDWAAPNIWRLHFAHRCEVALNQTEQETRARKRLWRAVDLKREVSPFTRSRLFYAKRKIRAGGAGKTRGVTHWPNLLGSFHTLAEQNGFLELENYEREVVRFDHEGGYVLSFRDEEYDLSPKAAEAWLHTFAKEGAEAAAEELK